MIDLYIWPTPNGHRSEILLEMAGVVGLNLSGNAHG